MIVSSDVIIELRCVSLHVTVQQPTQHWEKEIFLCYPIKCVGIRQDIDGVMVIVKENGLS